MGHAGFHAKLPNLNFSSTFFLFRLFLSKPLLCYNDPNKKNIIQIGQVGFKFKRD